MSKYSIVWWSGMIAFVGVIFWPLFGPKWWWLSIPSVVWVGIASIWMDKMLSEEEKMTRIIEKIIKGEMY